MRSGRLLKPAKDHIEERRLVLRNIHSRSVPWLPF